MHKEKNRRSQVQNWSTASASLRDYVGKNCKRAFLAAKSIWIYAFSKDYFSEHYRALEEVDYTVISREDYLKELERLDIADQWTGTSARRNQ